MSVLLLDTNLQAALPNPDLDVLTSNTLLQRASAAEHGGAALPLDADALIGRFPEVEDRHRCHAPSEESPLLQLMEAYSGLAILATNLKQALDVACIEERA
jgi:hypothetical protein